MFLKKMFPSLPTVGNMTKHRQETMFLQLFPSLPRALFSIFVNRNVLLVGSCFSFLPISFLDDIDPVGSV